MTAACYQAQPYGFSIADRSELAALRRAYPRWGFVLMGQAWVAVRGCHTLITASSPQELRRALPPAPGDVPYPSLAVAVVAYRTPHRPHTPLNGALTAATARQTSGTAARLIAAVRPRQRRHYQPKRAIR